MRELVSSIVLSQRSTKKKCTRFRATKRLKIIKIWIFETGNCFEVREKLSLKTLNLRTSKSSHTFRVFLSFIPTSGKLSLWCLLGKSDHHAIRTMSLSYFIVLKRESFPNVFADIRPETSSPEIKNERDSLYIKSILLINLVISGTFDDCPLVPKFIWVCNRFSFWKPKLRSSLVTLVILNLLMSA